MSSSPKIIVLKMREIIYTLVLLFLAVLLILCLILMFSKKQSGTEQFDNSANKIHSSQTDSNSNTNETQTDTFSTSQADMPSTYTPGIYTSSITLGESAVDVEVTVDNNHINAIRLVNLHDSVTVSYPLITPALEHISSQILEKQSLDKITASPENKYTSQLLLSAISDALSLARKNASS